MQGPLLRPSLSSPFKATEKMKKFLTRLGLTNRVRALCQLAVYVVLRCAHAVLEYCVL